MEKHATQSRWKTELKEIAAISLTFYVIFIIFMVLKLIVLKE